MTPSKYQQAVYDFVKNGEGHGVVNAVAGSGKTTTIVNALKLIPMDKQVLFCAFNAHIAKELKNRINQFNVTVSTLNAFGWQIVRNKYGRVELDGYKTEKYMKYRYYDLRNQVDKKEYAQYGYVINRLVGLLRADLVDVRDNYQFTEIVWDLFEKHGFEEVSNPVRFIQVLQNVYEACIENTSIFDFDDQIFQPIYRSLPIPQFDFVFVDEAQDLNKAQVELVKRAGKRIIAVGDPYQAIYGFRGADPEAIDNIIKATNATVLPLSICYRCPKSVVKAASEIVPEIEPSDSAPEGSISTIRTDRFREQAKDGDYVLCRTTAPLVSECLRFIRGGKKAMVKGREIGQGLITLTEKLGQPDTDVKVAYEELRRLQALEHEKAAKTERDTSPFDDKVDTIVALMEDSLTIRDVIRKIEEIFSDEERPGIILMTAHKSKGLEAKRIYILHPELMPFPKAKKPWQKKQEMNLKYVAITRSQDELIWVN